MSWFKTTSLLVMLLVAAPALAQQLPSPPRPLRGYLIGGGGASIGTAGTAETAVTLSAEIAENMTRNIQAYMSAVFYDNIMSDAATNQLALVGNTLSALTGTPWVFSGRDKGRSFTFGAKVLMPATSSVHPYVGGGFGALNVRRVIHEQSRGNITQAYLSQFGSPDGFVDPTDTDTTHPMGEVAAGVGAVIKKAYVDVGYRYRKAFHTGTNSFEISQVGAAVGVKF
jgi:Outer membrane protein beta-barrel domain